MWIVNLLSPSLSPSRSRSRRCQPTTWDYTIVRADMFAGLAGDAARFAKAMAACERTLAREPKHPEALVWHGSGLFFQAGQAFQQGDMANGGPLWDRGLGEMNEAVSLAPDSLAVVIPRAAVLLQAARFVPPPMAAPLLKTGVGDYEHVLELQRSYFHTLGDHPEGELLFGLADGYARLGDKVKARAYFERLIAEAPTSGHAPRGRAWIETGGRAAGTGTRMLRLPQMNVTPRASGYLVRMAAANLAATVFVAVAFIGVGFRTPWRVAVEALGVAFLFSICIGTLCAVFIPRVSPRLWRHRFPLNWLMLIACMFGFAMAGSALTIAILTGNRRHSGVAVYGWLLGSARYAIVTTLLFGISISAYEMARTRLDEAALALRTKERDEAEARRAAIETQFASLESRVQPHFLFNTLNSIARSFRPIRTARNG